MSSYPPETLNSMGRVTYPGCHQVTQELLTNFEAPSFLLSTYPCTPCSVCICNFFRSSLFCPCSVLLLHTSFLPPSTTLFQWKKNPPIPHILIASLKIPFLILETDLILKDITCPSGCSLANGGFLSYKSPRISTPFTSTLREDGFTPSL